MAINLTDMVDYLLTQSWQLAILVVVVTAVNFTLRNRSAHIRYLLWMIVLAKCLLPPVHTIPLAILPEKEPPEPASMFTYIEMSVPETVVPQSSRVESEKSPPPVTRMPTTPIVKELHSKITLYELAGICWIVGAGVILIFNLLRALRANLWLWKRRKPLPVELRSNIKKLFAEHGVDYFPDVWLVEGFNQPFVWGLLRGSIYLPVDFLKINQTKHQKSVLGHELSHVIRFDAAVNILQVVAQAIFWFHPLIWWANRKIRAEREKCCDEMAIAQLNTSPRDYSTAILETLAAKHAPTRPVPSLAVAGPVKNIEERIKIMLSPGRKFYTHPSLITAIAVLLLALLTVPTTLILSSRAQANTPDSFAGKSDTYGELEYIDHLSRDNKLARPTSIALSPDGRHFYVTAFGSRCVTILSRDQLTGNVKINNTIPLKGAFAVCVSPDGRYVVCSDVKSGPDFYSGSNTLSLFERDNSTGELTLLDSIKNEENGIDSLDNVVDICFSPNSEFVYAIARRSAAITVFQITNDRKLLFVQSYKGQDNCFDGGRGIDISPDGKYVYVVSVDAGTLAVLQSDTKTGKISLKQVLKDEQGDIHALSGVWDVTCSPDGRFIYTNSGRQQGEENDNAVCAFERTADGTLTRVQEFRTNEAQIGLAGGGRLDFSPDGEHLYALGHNSDSMASFQRDMKTGKLKYLQTLSFRRLNNKYCLPSDLTFSPDGSYVYVAGEGISINGIILLKRLPWMKKGTAEELYEVACKGDKGLLESAIKKGIEINARGQGGYTALHWAAHENQKQAATLLLDAGADVNARTETNGWTALHIAAMHSNKDVSKILIDRGADLDAVNNNNRKTPLVVAQFNGDLDFAAFLLDSGAKFDSRDRWGQTPLHQAATQGDIAFAELLINKGADINAKDKSGLTPLFMATRWHQMQMIKWLISKGADVNTIMQGQTPLHMACGIGWLDVVELLIAHGADVNVKGNNGLTPLSAALESNHTDIIELLKKHGAKE